MARAVDFGYHGDATANIEMATHRRLAVRYVADSRKFPYLNNQHQCELVLVPTPQELRFCSVTLGERTAAVSVYCARVYRALRYVLADGDARVEMLTE